MDASWLKDGFTNARSGVSSAFDAEELLPDTLSWAKNVSHRGGKPGTRPPLVERLRLPPGRLQGIEYFSAGRGMFVAQISGRLHRITASGNVFSTQPIPLGFPNAPKLPTAWMCETDGTLVIQDGQSSPILYDGAAARRADRNANEVPIGRMMAFGNGRLWVVINDHEIVAGNIKTSAAGSELIFTETGYLTGGGAFYFPTKLRGLAFLPIADTTSGKGSILVFSTNETQTMRAEVSSRDLWQQIPGFITTTLPRIGCLSQHCLVPVNQDLFFRSQNGDLRSLRSARAEIASAGEAPLSREVSRLFDHESHDLLDQASGIYHDNRLLMTASPFIGARGQTMFADLMSLDLAPLSSMQGRLPPVYDGEWDGITFVRLLKGEFSGRERAFAVVCDANGTHRLMEFDKTVRADSMAGAVSPIKASVETRRFTFGNIGQLKRLEACRISLSGIEGSGTVTVYFQSNHHKQWVRWDEFTYSAQGSDPTRPRNLQPQFRSAVKLLTIPDAEASPITLQRLHVGFGFQLRIVWTGFATLDRVEVYASPLAESCAANRADLPTEPVALETFENEVVYQIPTPPIGNYVNQTAAVYADHTADNYSPV